MKPLRCIAFLAVTSLFQDAFAQTTLPPLFLTNVSSSVSRNVSYVLRAWPGDYTVLSATNLAGAWTNEVDVSVGSSGAYAGVVPVLGRSNLFLRAMGRSPSDGLGCIAQFTTQGAAFEPDVRTTGEPAEFLWLWSDGTTSTNRPIASKSFGSTGKRMQGLKLSPTNAITSINLGFDGADGGWTTPLAPRASQGVSAVRIPYPLPSLRWWASSYNPIASTLDFSGYTSLEAIECFNCGALRHVVVTNLPALYRVCFEDCNLQALDLSGNPNLGDVRGALNAFTSIRTERGTGPNVWHWCTRDNPQLTQNFQDIMTNFYSLRELYIWNDNQHGHFTTSSTNLIDAQLYDNHFTSADFTGQSRMVNCILFVNDLTNLVLTGCSGLVNLDASYNDLTTTALDHVLTVLDNSAPGISTVNLAHNAEFASPAGLAHYTNLVNRGVVVMLDLPENPNVHHDGVWGGTNAITFITTNRITRMEIQCASTPTSVVWRWGDGTTNTGTLTAGHDFGGIGRFTNYVEVLPRTAVTRFGSQSGYTQQGIKGVYGASNFPNLNYLYLYQESLTDLSLAGCSNLTQLHLAENPVSTAVCDQWFLDLDAAVAGPVAGADFFYPGPARSAASNPAWTNLVNKGYAMHPINVGYFGAQNGTISQGITGVFGLTNFPNLYYLFLYHESVKELSLAGCHHLTQLHLADNPVSTAVCDQWFLDLDAAVPGPVTSADFFYPSSQRTFASDAAWQSLVNKGYVMHPF